MVDGRARARPSWRSSARRRARLVVLLEPPLPGGWSAISSDRELWLGRHRCSDAVGCGAGRGRHPRVAAERAQPSTRYSRPPPEQAILSWPRNPPSTTCMCCSPRAPRTSAAPRSWPTSRPRSQSGGGIDRAQRRLGHAPAGLRIRHQREAEYHLLQFNGPPALLEALSHGLRIDDGVLRFRIIKVAAPGSPTAARGRAGRPVAVGTRRARRRSSAERRGAPGEAAPARRAADCNAFVTPASRLRLRRLQRFRPFSAESAGLPPDPA